MNNVNNINEDVLRNARSKQVVNMPLDFFTEESVSRSRDEVDEEAMQVLMRSIKTVGLLQPVGATIEGELIWGSRRYVALSRLQNEGFLVQFGDDTLELGTIPTVLYQETMTAEELANKESAENESRQELSHADAARLTARLADFETKREIAKAEKAKILFSNLGKPKEQLIDVDQLSMEELVAMRRKRRGDKPLTEEQIKADREIREKALETTAKRKYNTDSGRALTKVKSEIQVDKALTENPEIEEEINKAKNANSAYMVVKKKRDERKNAIAAKLHSQKYTSDGHDILHGDCLQLLEKCKPHTFDVLISDPIYGIGAHTFNDGDEKLQSAQHDYDDSIETFMEVMPKVIDQLHRVMSLNCHMYMACDIRNFPLLRDWIRALNHPKLTEGNWFVSNQPIIQVKVNSGRVTNPGFTFRNSYECWLYAYRGELRDTGIFPNVIETTSDPKDAGKEWHGARKPKKILQTFVQRSCRPGHKILDVMAGTTHLLEIAHEAKCYATLMEQNEVNYGKLIRRHKNLNLKPALLQKDTNPEQQGIDAGIAGVGSISLKDLGI